MKILVLGHRGMLGSELMELLASGHEMIGRDVDEVDITSPASCREVIAKDSPDAVINAAAYTNVDGAETDRERCFAINVEGVRNVARMCRARGALMVHFSTDYVFSGDKGSPYVEEDDPRPISVYGASKAEGEKALITETDNYLLVRTAWLYGKNGHNFVKTILAKISRRERLFVVDDQIGSPTWTLHLARAVKLLLEGDHRGVFHITNRGSCSWYDFAKKIVDTGGFKDVSVEPITTEALGRPAARPPYSVLSCRKFRKYVGKILPPWQVALREFLEKTGHLA